MLAVSQEPSTQVSKSEALWDQLTRLDYIEQRLENLIIRIRGNEQLLEPIEPPESPPVPAGSLNSLLSNGVHYTERTGKKIHTRISEIEELLF